MESTGVQIAQVLAVALSLGTLFVLLAGAVLLWMSAAKREPELKPVYVPAEARRRSAYAAMARDPQGYRVSLDERAPSTLQPEDDDRIRWNPRV